MGIYLSTPNTSKESQDLINDKFYCGLSSMQGWRSSQEDAHNMIPNFYNDMSLFAVYDGHGGPEVAKYTSDNFPQYLKNYLMDNNQETLEKNLEKAFLSFDLKLKEPEIIEELRIINESDGDLDEQKESNENIEFTPKHLSPVISKKKKNISNSMKDNTKNKDTSLNDVSTSSGVEVFCEEELEQHECSLLKSEANLPLEMLRKQYGGKLVESDQSSSSQLPQLACNSLISDQTKSMLNEFSQIDNISPPFNKKITNSLGLNQDDLEGEEGEDDDFNVDYSEDETSLDDSEETDDENEIHENSSDEANNSFEHKEGQKNELHREESILLHNKLKNKKGGTKRKINLPDQLKTGNNIETGHNPKKIKNKDDTKEIDKENGYLLDENDQDPYLVNDKKSNKQQCNGDLSQTSILESANEKKEEGGDYTKTDVSSSGEVKKEKRCHEGEGVDSEILDADNEAEKTELENKSEAEDDTEEEDVEENEDAIDDEDEDDNDEEALSMEEGGSNFLHSFVDNRKPSFDSGCTAVLGLIKDFDLYVANIGDSRCVLSEEGQAIDMSLDHKPEDPLEKERIVKAGGVVTEDGRVNEGLNLSRAFGDHYYKEDSNISACDQMIIALPDVKHIKLTEKHDFLVFACDGIWNSMTSQEVVDFISERKEQYRETPSKICEEIFEHCLAPDSGGDGTGCDNMTCVIIFFKKEMFNV